MTSISEFKSEISVEFTNFRLIQVNSNEFKAEISVEFILTLGDLQWLQVTSA